MRGKRTVGIYARCRFHKVDAFRKVVVEYKPAHLVGVLFLDILLYRFVFSFDFLCFFYYRVVIDAEYLGEALCHELALSVIFHIVGRYENALRGIICREGNMISVIYRAACASRGNLIYHLLDNEPFIVFVSHYLKIYQSSDKYSRNKCSGANYRKRAHPHASACTPYKGIGFFTWFPVHFSPPSFLKQSEQRAYFTILPTHSKLCTCIFIFAPRKFIPFSS